MCPRFGAEKANKLLPYTHPVASKQDLLIRISGAKAVNSRLSVGTIFEIPADRVFADGT
jgi:hypothetical protein